MADDRGHNPRTDTSRSGAKGSPCDRGTSASLVVPPHPPPAAYDRATCSPSLADRHRIASFYQQTRQRKTKGIPAARACTPCETSRQANALSQAARSRRHGLCRRQTSSYEAQIQTRTESKLTQHRTRCMRVQMSLGGQMSLRGQMSNVCQIQFISSNCTS